MVRAALLWALLITNAGASTIFVLDRDGCSGTCGTGPFANITLEQLTATTVEVTEVLAPNEYFTKTGAGPALTFNAPGALVIENLTEGFAAGPAPVHASAFGEFMYSVVCTVCKGGKTSNPSAPLSFTVTSATGVTIADFRPNVGGFYFASDIRGNNGRTGNVAARTFFMDSESGAEGSEVPEPIPLILVGTALVGLGLRRRFAAPG